MEEEISCIKKFLKEFFNNEQSPTSEEATRIGNYALDLEDVSGHIVDWVINYLDNRKCPYSLAVSVAKEIALQISASLNQNEVENFEKLSNSTDLYSEAISKIPAVCNAFLNQDNLEPISSTKFSTSVFAIRNKRRKMEDRHVILHDLNAVLDLKDAPYQSYYAVFDGHSGIDAACYASAQLHINIGKHPDFLTDTSKAIIEGYQITDKNFLNKCNKSNIKSGCTALSALIRNNTLFLSWLGDSQAVLVKEGVPVKITSPHKPDREDERLRIEQLGGHISHMGTWRVNGLLAVTRAIGDPDQKPFISSEPELDVINLDGTEDFLILACDGLWDGISPEDASSALYRYLADNSPDDIISPVAAKLVHQSKLQGSEDNITAIVVFLRDVKDIISNVDKFLSKSSMYYEQNHDFMSMNGNMKILSMDSNSDIPFSKPTVLELNAASSKKLKNAANVMSSAGFGSTSYSYQFVENLDESSFHSLESSVVDSSQTAYMSQAAHSASCFAPETTALSELPTPPIDDILASQQFDNFHSTDLYKELNKSVLMSEQHVEGIDKTESNVEVSSQFNNNTFVAAENKSSCNVENNSETASSSVFSPDDAFGIASDVVSTTIETAVKCLAEESLQPPPVQSSTKLNPYAEPFVMKSFFNPEESDPMSTSFIGSNLDDVSPCKEANPKTDSQPSTIEGIDSSQSNSTDLEKEKLLNISNQSNTNLISLEQPVPEQSVQSENVSGNLDVAGNEFENKIPDTSNLEIDNISSDNLPQNISSSNLLGEFQETTVTTTYHSEVSSETFVPVSENINIEQPVQSGLSEMSQLRINFEKIRLESSKSQSDFDETNVSHSAEGMVFDLNQISIENQNFLSKSPEVGSVDKCIIQTVDSEVLVAEENQNLNNISSNLNSDNIVSNVFDIESKPENGVKVGNTEKVENVIFPATDKAGIFPTDVPVDQLQIKELGEVLASNQNSDLSNTPEIIETDIKSNFEEIKKSIVDAVVKNENSDSSNFVESVSLISNIKNELVSAESEVPSDPSVEDSRIEPVAVDLKSLPEGIPEAEGVTEDIDSDSEKDGGWSYMKGNIATGSKPKQEEKISKTTKSNETKSNIATKSKRDISKPSLDIKNRAKNTIVDKTKSSTTDKSKTISQDKTKSITDKTKGVAPVDKTRTLGATDKAKKITLERKTEVKSKVLKSSTTTTAKIVSDKTSKIASASSTVRKVTSETTGNTTATSNTTTAKPTRPTTLLRTTAPSVDKSTSSSRATPKPKVTSLSSENKLVKPNVTSVINKRPISAQNKSSTLSNRTTTSRPAATVATKTSTVARTAAQKATVSEPKPKLPTSSATTARKPLSAVAKKLDVKEAKDNVNQQILAKKTTTASRVHSNFTLTNRKVVSYNNKSASAKASSVTKTEINKRDVPKAASSKPGFKKTDSKTTPEDSKNKEQIIESVQTKTDETKEISNVESDKKEVSEAAEGVEEKFILETNDKEVPKEMNSITNEEQIVENGSLMKTVSPDEIIPTTECNPENLS